MKLYWQLWYLFCKKNNSILCNKVNKNVSGFGKWYRSICNCTQHASTFLKLNIYRDCDFINKYLMTRYDKRNYLHRYDMFIIIYLSLCHVMFTFTCTGVAWCLWTLRSWSGCPSPRRGWMDMRIKWRMRFASTFWICLSDMWMTDWHSSGRSVSRASTR